MREYQNVGVDYDLLDRSKRNAIQAAQSTAGTIVQYGGRENPFSRGEAAYVFEIAGLKLAFVMECLGTKSILAKEYWELTGENLFGNIGHDAVAAAVNDVASTGARPLVINAYFATGGSTWHEQPELLECLIDGWRRACEDASVVWGGGESPSLPGLISQGHLELAGACVGFYPPDRNPRFGELLAPGDRIVLISSSGLHANGASLARRLAEGLPEGLLYRLPSGRTLGEALLDRSLIYVKLLDRLLEDGVRISYISHITGHGWRKIMRAEAQLTYKIDRLPPVPEALDHLGRVAGLDIGSAYGVFNMGAGLAIFCRDGAEEIVRIARGFGIDATEAGVAEAGPRRVIIEPLSLCFEGEELRLR